MLTRRLFLFLWCGRSLSQASLPHSSAMISSVKGAYWIWNFFFSHGKVGVFGGLFPIHLMCMWSCKMSLNSRVNLVSCFQFIPSFIFILFPFCLSPVKFDIILFLKVEFILRAVFFFVGWEKVSSSQSMCSKAKMKLDVRVGSSRVCSSQG
jgi:hypothetical protein